MPIYEYECEACGHRLEALQKMADDPLTDCPACEEPRLRKLVSAAAFRLKGGGWYETDFKTGDQKNLAGRSEAREAKSADKTAGKSPDSKTGSTGKAAGSGSA
ncbi:MAG TPA: zinc ribbon domain-containing protein [Chromatiales bacterium]|nr:zinc ribbon domain-containing protein [Chromatiales bacterium]